MKTFVVRRMRECIYVLKIFCLRSPNMHAYIHVSVACVCVLFTQFCEYEYISVHREMARVCLHVNKNVCTVHTQNTVATQRFGMNVILVEIVLHIHNTHTCIVA